ncbi:MAG: hypothetical protein F2793_05290 [Actinobacteria bacterium]|uniref:Unannotated protein n=1 Tax=freshwater metagenome TaxID=449393 RepID=A0A6J7E4T7_9ZZZZ|nr:hypothetical protein [Actinomycetota bacterium]
MSDVQTVKKPSRRSSAAGRRAGYVIAIIINAVLLYLINGRPGWESWDVLTADFVLVLWLVNLSLSLSFIANVLYLVYDVPWFKATCELVLAVVSLAVAVRGYQVFPFDFSSFAYGWTVLVRLILVVAMIGSSIAIIVQLVKLVRAAVGAGEAAS